MLTQGYSDDTTQIDQPDTPAPVFAARALKSAFFGEPDKANDDATMTTQNPADTPSKPNGILLTPGTGTSRRKRVSFGREVLEKGPQAEEKKDGLRSNNGTRKRTRLTELMENSRRDKAKSSSGTTEQKQLATDARQGQAEDDEWEEEEDDDFCTHDITVDLNEPHSRSGKYWKTNFETYHQDAKTEMEKLLKYKELAKSYAKMKDAEAVELQDRLREEQVRVGDMEKRLTEMASQIATKRLKGDDKESTELMRDLAKQTALAVQYKDQVKELESLVKGHGSDADTKGGHRRTAGTPRGGGKALMDAQRELRRAKSQLRDMEDLKDEVKRLKVELKTAEQGSSKATERSGRNKDESSYVKDLLAQLRDAKAESRKKDDQLEQLTDDYEKFRGEAVARQDDARRVLAKATEKISELKRELRTLKATKDERGARPSNGTGATSLENRRTSRDDDGPDIHVDLRDLARLTNSASPPGDRPTRHDDVEKNADGRRAKSSLSSRALRNKFLDDTIDAEADPAPESPVRNVLADRVNLERPKWQPYIPRSPRNRAYFMKDLGKRRGGGGAGGHHHARAHDDKMARETRATMDHEDDEPKVDLLRDRFRHLGLPDADADASVVTTGNASRCTLPPERRAAALARIEQRKAERSRMGLETRGRDKENVRPGASRRGAGVGRR